ncbi:uncharacterized protein FA14DRAFT_159348 [Meira miltonrushii]|uniref:S15/NS1 RNA-binding domain-containing protein n=1 Tax=Meira miltonrushii TaxID=1280837 RepID=A0A316VLD9_9BASI|nr:uncharacterized protein FA14DRAFT_159348 [Meira miltonrushii]PWN37183.1 hypothetical protein FA14DRAFT_159348 [Meira miltonrushii]
MASFRTLLPKNALQASRSQSITSGPSSLAVAHLHSSAAVNAVSPSVQKRERERQKRKAAEQKQLLRQRIFELTKPDPVLGHQMNEKGEAVWKNSELRKIILTKDDVWGVREDRRGNLIEITEEAKTDDASTSPPEEGIQIGPKRLNFGLDSQEDRQLLFGNLPATILEDYHRAMEDQLLRASQDELLSFSQNMQENEEIEQGHTDLLGRLLDLRNANGKGIQVENIRRITNHFGQRPAMEDGKERGLDTGSPEVQAAVLTYRIRNLHEHLETKRHDNSNRRGMTALVQKRAKILKYLKRESISRYNTILPRLGIEPRAVEGEVTVPGKPKMNASV